MILTRKLPIMTKNHTAFMICLLLTALAAGSASASSIKNIILMIGDGMGPEQVKAGRMYNGAPLSFESFPYQTMMTVYTADSSEPSNPPDSGATATAMATGVNRPPVS